MRARSPFGLTLLAGIISAVAIAGCGGTTGASAGTSASKHVTLTVWDVAATAGTPPDKARVKIDQQFMKLHPNIKVVHIGFPYTAYWPIKVQTVIAARRGPDVLMVYPNPQFYKGLWPMRTLVDASPLKRSLLWFGWDSQDPAIHQLPWTTYAYGFLFNKTMFRRAGLDPNSPPTTWSQLLQSCQKLSAAGITPLAAGFKDGLYGDWLVSYGIASRLFSKTQLQQWYSNHIGWNVPQMRQALELFLQLKSNRCFAPGSEGKSLSDTEPDFLGKRAAMLYNVLGNFSTYTKPLGAGNVGIFRMPTIPGQVYNSQPVDSGANVGYAISRFTKSCSAAWSYLSFLDGPVAQRMEYDLTGTYPNNLDVVATAQDPLDRQVLAWLKNPDDHTGPAEIGSQESVVAEKGYPQLITGQMTVNQFIQQTQAARQQSVIATPSVGSTPACN